jgi:NADPH:quinone reductase-like Zn-dependent oxidoreductase
VANHSLPEFARALNPKGIYVGAGVLGLGHSATGILGGLLRMKVASLFVRQKAVTFTARASQPDLRLLGELMATRKVTPVLDRCYPLSEAAVALCYLAEGHARGKVVISLEAAGAA